MLLKQPGHLVSECRKRLAKLAAQSTESKAEEPVNFVATVPSRSCGPLI